MNTFTSQASDTTLTCDVKQARLDRYIEDTDVGLVGELFLRIFSLVLLRGLNHSKNYFVESVDECYLW